MVTALPLYHVFRPHRELPAVHALGGYNLPSAIPRHPGFVKEIKKYPFTCITGQHPNSTPWSTTASSQGIFCQAPLKAAVWRCSERWPSSGRNADPDPAAGSVGPDRVFPLVSPAPTIWWITTAPSACRFAPPRSGWWMTRGNLRHPERHPGEMQVRGPQVMTGCCSARRPPPR